MHMEHQRVLDHDDLDHVRVEVNQGLFPMSLDLLGPPRTAPAFRFRGRLTRTGPLSLGKATYTAALRIGIPTVRSLYYINLPTSGSSLSADCRDGAVDVAADHGLLLRPGDNVWINSCDGYRSHAIMIDGDALERRLSALTGKPTTGPIRFGPRLNLATGAGASWARMVRWFTEEATATGSLLSNPLMAEPLHELLLTGLLAVAEHPDRQDMEKPVASCAPVYVRRAMEAINDHAAEPLTSACVAEAAGVSIKSLQVGFQRHLNTTPMRYLREVRLVRAHDELRLADPDRTTVTQVALKWGFTNPGRFAQTYAQRYGRYPSETLRHL